MQISTLMLGSNQGVCCSSFQDTVMDSRGCKRNYDDVDSNETPSSKCLRPNLATNPCKAVRDLGLANNRTQWAHRPRRKDRGQERVRASAPPQPQLTPPSRQLDVRRAAAPAKLNHDQMAAIPSRARGLDQRLALSLETLAARFATGRTLANLVAVMQARLFSVTDSIAQTDALKPVPGLFASHQGLDVFIVNAFSRHRVDQVDILPLRPTNSDGIFIARWKDVFTCPQSELSDVGAHFQPASTSSSRARLTMKFARVNVDVHVNPTTLHAHLAMSWFQFWRSSPGTSGYELCMNSGQHSLGFQACSVVPERMQAHVDQFRVSGETHLVKPRSDEKQIGFVLDLPLPIPFDMRGYRCITCQTDRTSDCTFQVIDDDVRRVFPGVLVCTQRQERKLYMTRRFLVHLVLSFYDVLNARALRRKLVEYYTSNM